MPGSFQHFDTLIADRIGIDFPDREGTWVLDVGAGAGKYRELLWDFPHVDAVEAHEPYVDAFQLRQRYQRVYVQDIRDVINRKRVPVHFYRHDLVIFGDVIEHLTVEDAQQVLALFKEQATLVAVPYNYDQDDVYDVEWERHIQSDLTHELFMQRYPGFECLARDDVYGIYVRDPLRRWSLGEVPERPCVSLVIPTADHKINTHCMTSLWQLQGSHLQYEINQLRRLVSTPGLTDDERKHQLEDLHRLASLAINPSGGASVEKNRNRGIVTSLKEPKVTHVCFVDSDEGWAPDTVGQLLQHRAQVIGVPIRLKVQDLHWNVSAIPGSTQTRWNGRLLEVGGIGTGFLLVARSALERMMAAYPELHVLDADNDHYTLFQTGQLSEDLTFCERWRALGGRVWADPTIEVCHVGLAEFTGRLADHMEVQPRQPAFFTADDSNLNPKENAA